MSSIQLTLQYEGHEAHVEVPLHVSLQEGLRRVRLKQGPNPYEELAHQVSDDIRDHIKDQRLIRGLILELIRHIDV
jgi:hypothetical protein